MLGRLHDYVCHLATRQAWRGPNTLSRSRSPSKAWSDTPQPAFESITQAKWPKQALHDALATFFEDTKAVWCVSTFAALSVPIKGTFSLNNSVLVKA